MFRRCFLITLCLVVWPVAMASAHFDILIGDKAWVDRGETVTYKYYSGHPFEAELADREVPAKVEAIDAKGNRTDLKAEIQKKSAEYDGKQFPQYEFKYMPKRTGDVIIAVEGARHFMGDHCGDAYCKAILHCKRSDGWDQEVGHPIEIIPYTRPYGLRAGAVFCGVVKVDGKPAEGIEIEFEEFNESPPPEIPEEPLVTGVVKTDSEGNFQITLDREGWWGMAAHTELGTVKKDGKDYTRNVGTYFWVYVHPGR